MAIVFPSPPKKPPFATCHNNKLEKHLESADLRLVNVQQYVHVYFTRARTVTAAVACAETVDCMYV